MIDAEEIKAGDILAWNYISGERRGIVEEVGGDLLVRVQGGGILPLEDIVDSYSIKKL